MLIIWDFFPTPPARDTDIRSDASHLMLVNATQAYKLCSQALTGFTIIKIIKQPVLNDRVFSPTRPFHFMTNFILTFLVIEMAFKA